MSRKTYIYISTSADFYHLHWYKELRTKKERCDLYNLARRCGADRSQASRIRDLSPHHAQNMLIQLIARNHKG